MRKEYYGVWTAILSNCRPIVRIRYTIQYTQVHEGQLLYLTIRSKAFQIIPLTPYRVNQK